MKKKKALALYFFIAIFHHELGFHHFCKLTRYTKNHFLGKNHLSKAALVDVSPLISVIICFRGVFTMVYIRPGFGVKSKPAK